MRQLQKRLATLEARQALPQPDVAPELTPDEVLTLVFACVRDALITHDGQQWQPTYYTTVWADMLNDMAGAQPGAAFIPLRESERMAALAALAAGRFGFLRNYPPYDKYQPKDARTGTPILCSASWSDHEAEALTRGVHQSAYLWHCQTGGKMPATLGEFGAWLQSVEGLTPLP